MLINEVNTTEECLAAIAQGNFRHACFLDDHPHMPLVDFYAAFSNDAEVRLGLAIELGLICRHVGYFSIRNHGVARTLLDQAQDEIERFFRLPFEAKNALHIGGSGHHRGYVPCGEEKSLHSSTPDIKEVFDIARELPVDHPKVMAKVPFHGPNVWPDDAPAFKTRMNALFDGLLGLSARISGLFALCFGQQEDFFDATLREHLCEMRLLKYPPQPEQAMPGQIGCGEHTDYGIVSLLWQIDRGGVEVQRRDGAWFSAERIPETFVCVLGDMTARWTNGAWPATVHRVVNRAEGERHSVAFFCDPSYDCLVEPLPHFVGPDNPPRFAPITMGAHMQNGYDGSFQYRATH